MQTGVDQVKEVIEEDIWGNILDFFNISIISFESGERVTVGILKKPTDNPSADE